MDEIAKNHHARVSWDRVMRELRQQMQRREVAAFNTVVLLPYAQLIQLARAAWARSEPAGANAASFTPRFETTQNWTRSLGGFVASGDDLRLDAARDLLTAASLLERAGLGAQQSALSARLLESAWSLARLAAAVPPAERSAWGTQRASAMRAQPAPPVLEVESSIGQIALAWVANSAYRTDSLFAASADLLVLLEGLQPEPLHDALRLLWAKRALTLQFDQLAPMGAIALHAARDAEDEAARAASCVLAHLAKGRSPVGLVAQDRMLTRRVRALLGERGVVVRDETGWTLSTTRAAASVMGTLRAAAWDASTDIVLDWVKNAPAFDAGAVAQLEAALRRQALRDWRAVSADQPVTARLEGVRAALQSARPLAQWLQSLREVLQETGMWPALCSDIAGQAVLEALRLRNGAEREFAEFPRRIGHGDFVSWVSQTLEAASFLPPHPLHEQVVILPSTQLLARELAAVVFPGCDEVRLPAVPDAPGSWTPAQRALLGLAQREQLAVLARAAWQYALRSPAIDILWRASENGERLMPSPLVQELLLQTSALAPDPRIVRTLRAQPATMPRPVGAALPVRRLSASAYGDLRDCPYRFFALRQLGLRESDELDADLDKRDFGNWLHLVLRHFHEALADHHTRDGTRRLVMIDAAADRATRERGLAQSEFLPFAASWQRVRLAYLAWLEQHEAGGARFTQAEVAKEMPLGLVTLEGRIDRVDRLADGTALVMDYKTESRDKTQQRIKDAGEDTQLAFYGALLSDDSLAAMYLNIGETRPTKAYPQSGIVALRDQLVEGIRHDMRHIDAGSSLPAIGEGSACRYCAARGLCRKDFWDTDASAEALASDV